MEKAWLIDGFDQRRFDCKLDKEGTRNRARLVLAKIPLVLPYKYRARFIRDKHVNEKAALCGDAPRDPAPIPG
jgi:hypothetical protein